MERGFQSLLLTGKYGLSDCDFPFTSSGEMSYLTRSFEKSAFSSMMNYQYGSSYVVFDGNTQSSPQEYGKSMCLETEEKFKRLKTEPAMEFNFIPTTVFNQLPELLNPEERRFKQKFSLVETTANPTLTNFQLTANYFAPAPVQQLQPLRQPLPSPAKLSYREQAYKRRHTLSDKTRSLQKLLPVDRKMDMATIYEETHKYITFLKAQIAVLESMPVASTSASNFRSENPRCGGLGKLNRQQLLEVLVNSPAAQSILYSKGCCIYSVEQLILFNNIAEKSFFISDR